MNDDPGPSGVRRPDVQRRRLLGISAGMAALWAMPGSSARPESIPVYRWQGIALGAHTSLTIAHPDTHHSARLTEQVIEEIKRLERLFSLYRDDSALVILNRDQILAHPTPDMLALCTRITGIHRATQGAFDPTVQPDWRRRFLATSASATPVLPRGVTADDVKFTSGKLGNSGETANPDKRPSWRHVSVSNAAISFNQPDMALTFNGVAQGYISERVAHLLRQAGLSNVLVNIGEIVACGRNPESQPWQIGLARRSSDNAEDKLPLSDLAIATTAPQNSDNKHSSISSHLIDPRSGEPARSSWRRLSVIHPSATVADGLSTGLALLPANAIRKAAEAYPDARVVAVATDKQRLDVGPRL